MSIPFLRRNRYALQQLIAAIKSSEAPDVKGCKEAPAILEAWETIESTQLKSRLRISQLENELEAARELLRESAASALTHSVRFDLVNRASSEGLWDMEVVAGDPINPKNAFGGRSNFAVFLGLMTNVISPMSWPAGLIAFILRTNRGRLTPLLDISTISRETRLIR
ncbi:hypothetical protein [Pseudomonas sp. RA_105y_Pfl1_P41]|uniref:hypothetical protein n=1 Tax=unclassified Pseudomonas TaxID=196821 RepID=UPI00403F626B